METSLKSHESSTDSASLFGQTRTSSVISLPTFSLVGKKAFVTGASRGIGRACALMLAGAGADVAVGCSPAGAALAQSVCNEIRDFGRRTHAYAFDVGARGDVE